jgi:hypothetical protein
MASSDCVDIVSLHQNKILFHEIVWNRSAKTWVMLMPIGSFENNPFTVHFDQTVLQLYLADPNPNGSKLLLINRDYQVVEIWSLCGPFQRIAYGDREVDHALARILALPRDRSGLIAFAAQEFGIDLAAAVYIDLQMKSRIFIIVVKSRLQRYVLDSSAL